MLGPTNSPQQISTAGSKSDVGRLRLNCLNVAQNIWGLILGSFWRSTDLYETRSNTGCGRTQYQARSGGLPKSLWDSTFELRQRNHVLGQLRSRVRKPDFSKDKVTIIMSYIKSQVPWKQKPHLDRNAKLSAREARARVPSIYIYIYIYKTATWIRALIISAISMGVLPSLQPYVPSF